MDFKLRPWAFSDLLNLVRHANNYSIAKNLTDRFPHPYTEENGRFFINMANEQTPPHVLAIEVGGEAVGGIGLHQQTDVWHKNAELGYWLAEPFWGRGIMTAAIRQMVARGFENPDLERIFARPFGSNIGSQKVLEKAGFRLEGRFEKTIMKFGEWEDEVVYGVRRGGVK